MDQKTLIAEYDRLLHQYKNQLCVIKTMKTLLNSMDDNISSNIDCLNRIIEETVED